MEMARAVKDQVVASAAAGRLHEDDRLGLMFSRIARSIRQTVMLSIRLSDDQTRRQEPAAAAKPRPEPSASDDFPKDKPEPRPRGERAERLDDPDIDAEMGDRSPAEIIAEICRNLDLPEGHFLWTEARPGETASALSVRMLAEYGIDIVAISQRARAKVAAQRAAAAARDPP
jgi:hypothetical protein